MRGASEDELFAATRARALSALSRGTTTIEIKSGYGLSLEAELKQLRVIRRVGLETPLTVVPTLLAAHAVPPEFKDRADDYVMVVVDIVRAAARAALARFCDVFCEKGVFSPDAVPQDPGGCRRGGPGGRGCTPTSSPTRAAPRWRPRCARRPPITSLQPPTPACGPWRRPG